MATLQHCQNTYQNNKPSKEDKTPIPEHCHNTLTKTTRQTPTKTLPKQLQQKPKQHQHKANHHKSINKANTTKYLPQASRLKAHLTKLPESTTRTPNQHSSNKAKTTHLNTTQTLTKNSIHRHKPKQP